MKKENAPETEEEVIDSLFRNLPVAVLLLDENGRILQITKAAEELLLQSEKGIRYGDALGCYYALDDARGCGGCPSREDCDLNRAVLGAYLTGDVSSRREVKLLVGEDKRELTLIFSAAPHDANHGRGVLLFLEDISERKKAEKALKVSEENLKSSQENLKRAQSVAHVGSWHLDVVENILQWSDETYRIFGIPSASSPTYEGFLEIVHPDDRNTVDRKWAAAIAAIAAIDREPYDIEHRIIVNGTVKWVREKAEVEFDGNGRAIRGTGIVQDITDRKRTEEEKHSLQQELAHVLRVATISELTAAIAHELNQPLAAILANAQAAQRLLENKDIQLEEVKEIFADIIYDDKRASQIIVRLRALHKKSEFEFLPLDINDVVNEVVAFVRNDAMIRRISINKRLGEVLSLVSADRIQLQQVILNLAINSFDAMNGRERRELCIRTMQKGAAAVVVSVEDTGIGIDEKDFSSVFNPFFSTKSDGMGIGLSINKLIIETHGGEIGVKSNAEGGATFFFTLPALDHSTSLERDPT